MAKEVGTKPILVVATVAVARVAGRADFAIAAVEFPIDLVIAASVAIDWHRKQTAHPILTIRGQLHQTQRIDPEERH
jgi:hypothetical protein